MDRAIAPTCISQTWGNCWILQLLARETARWLAGTYFFKTKWNCGILKIETDDIILPTLECYSRKAIANEVNLWFDFTTINYSSSGCIAMMTRFSIYKWRYSRSLRIIWFGNFFSYAMAHWLNGSAPMKRVISIKRNRGSRKLYLHCISSTRAS